VALRADVGAVKTYWIPIRSAVAYISAKIVVVGISASGRRASGRKLKIAEFLPLITRA
jgi:hypothetical protein